MKQRGMVGGQAPLSADEQWLQDLSATYAQNLKYAQRGPYQTSLAAPDEASFREWVGKNMVPFQPASNDPQDYDMRGFYQGLTSGDSVAQTALNSNDGRLHYPDKWKTPYHHSFSAESQYAQPNAPRWINDHQLADPATGDVIWDERVMGRQPVITSTPLPKLTP